MERIIMGDRANVRVIDGYTPGESVYLYSHWSGSDLPRLVAEVLARGERWDDSAYLARMIFSAMVKGDIDGATGYGISATVGDGDDRIVAVDCGTQVVSIDGRVWPFGDYAKLDDVQF